MCVCVYLTGAGNSSDSHVYDHPGSLQLDTGSPRGLQEEAVEEEEDEEEGEQSHSGTDEDTDQKASQPSSLQISHSAPSFLS